MSGKNVVSMMAVVTTITDACCIYPTIDYTRAVACRRPKCSLISIQIPDDVDIIRQIANSTSIRYLTLLLLLSAAPSYMLICSCSCHICSIVTVLMN